MIKFYGILDKATGELSFAGKSVHGLWDDRESAEYELDKGRFTPTEEVVTLRIEPTEPCEWCETYGGEMIAPTDDLYAYECALDADDWNFCPNCGRSLT